jgi:hypothetical protein
MARLCDRAWLQGRAEHYTVGKSTYEALYRSSLPSCLAKKSVIG